MKSLRDRLLRIRPLVRAAQFAVTGERTPKRHRLLAAEVASGPHRSVLDLGCGSAPLLDFLAPERYVGIDEHEASLALARRRHAGVGREFIESSLADLPLHSWRGMDVVTIASVTHHLADAAVVELMERIVQHVSPQRLLVQDAHATGPLRPLVTALDDGDYLRHRDALIALLARQFEVAVLWRYDNPLRSFHQFLLELSVRPDQRSAAASRTPVTRGERRDIGGPLRSIPARSGANGSRWRRRPDALLRCQRPRVHVRPPPGGGVAQQSPTLTFASMSCAVPFVALERVHAPLRAELRAAFDRVVDTSAFVLGAEVRTFEDEFSAYCGASHCVGVASGTAALILALQALGIGQGDEVIVPAHTFVSSALAVLHAGATPVLCDVLPSTALIDPAAAASVVSERTAAVMAVHLYGQACDMDTLCALAQARGLALIEDAAQAHGASWRDVRVGTLGTIGCFSFYPTKNLGALGEGGAVTTGNGELAARVRALRDIGQTRKGEHQLPGYNERLDGLQAALLRVKLPHLDRANAARRRHAAAYRAGLDAEIRLVEETPASPSVHHLFPIRVDDRPGVAARLARAGIQTGLHYHPALTGHAALAGRARVPEPVPEAEGWAGEELSIPMFAEMTAEERAYVVAACLQAVGAVGSRQ